MNDQRSADNGGMDKQPSWLTAILAMLSILLGISGILLGVFGGATSGPLLIAGAILFSAGMLTVAISERRQ
jgi:hypothetical protein